MTVIIKQELRGEELMTVILFVLQLPSATNATDLVTLLETARSRRITATVVTVSATLPGTAPWLLPSVTAPRQEEEVAAMAPVSLGFYH